MRALRSRPALYGTATFVAIGLLGRGTQPPGPLAWEAGGDVVEGYLRCMPGRPRAEWQIALNPALPPERRAAVLAHEAAHADHAERLGCPLYNLLQPLPWFALWDEAHARCVDVADAVRRGISREAALQDALDAMMQGRGYRRIAVLGEGRVRRALARACAA